MGFGNPTNRQELQANAAISDMRASMRELCEAVDKWINDRSTGNEERLIQAHANYKQAQLTALTRRGRNGW